MEPRRHSARCGRLEPLGSNPVVTEPMFLWLLAGAAAQPGEEAEGMCLLQAPCSAIGCCVSAVV